MATLLAVFMLPLPVQQPLHSGGDATSDHSLFDFLWVFFFNLLSRPGVYPLLLMTNVFMFLLLLFLLVTFPVITERGHKVKVHEVKDSAIPFRVAVI